jgi:hypothetical protein
MSGHTFSRTRFHSSRSRGERRDWKRRSDSSASASMCSSSGSETTRPFSLRTTLSSRTSASANSRSSFGFERPTPRNR